LNALSTANKRLEYQESEREQRAAELIIADKELVFQQSEKEKRAAELILAEKELAFQQAEKGKRAAELIIADKELAYETERWKRASELSSMNEKLAAKNIEMSIRATELAVANKEKIELLAQLLQSQKMESLGIMAGGIAHDMNNILGAILSLATAHLTIQAKDAPVYPALETMRDPAIRGRQMVKRLLNFARQGPSETSSLDLNAVLLEEVRLLEYHTLATVHLDLDLAPDLHPIVGDASALTHVFMNLCVNAMDAMEEGGTLTLRSRNLGDDSVEIMVGDTGCGMSKEVLERAMVPFFTTKEVGKGTGLGLSIVYTTVRSHHGQRSFQSEPGKGTRVTLLFPVLPDGQVEASESVEPPVEAALATLTVLLVDDDDLLRTSVGMLLELLGHRVSAAASGEEGLAQITAGLQPDLVILDMNMPGLGGKGTLPRLRSLCPEVPVLLATGRADEKALSLIAAHPHVALLSKPFSIEELQAGLQLAIAAAPLP